MSDYITRDDLRRVLEAMRSDGLRGVRSSAIASALAALDAEQPKACAGFVCGGWVNSTGERITTPHGHIPCNSAGAPECDCKNCDQPYSAHQEQQEQADPCASKDHGIAQQEQAQQPAPDALLELVMPHLFADNAYRSLDGCDGGAVRNLFSAAQAYQRECERLSGELAERSNELWKAMRERDIARTALEEQTDLAVKYVRERDEAQTITHDSLREQDDLQREVAELTDKLAGLKAQEPVAWIAWHNLELLRNSGEQRSCSVYLRGAGGDRPLYAATVPPPDSIPLAQHDAALAEARREEREYVAKALEKLDKEQAAGFVRGLRHGHDGSTDAACEICDEIADLLHEAALAEARRGMKERCATVCLEQRCERDTPWDAAVLACVRAIRALPEEVES